MLFQLNASGRETVKIFLHAKCRTKPSAKMVEQWFIAAEASFNNAKKYLPERAIPQASVMLDGSISITGGAELLILQSSHFTQVS